MTSGLQQQHKIMISTLKHQGYDKVMTSVLQQHKVMTSALRQYKILTSALQQYEVMSPNQQQDNVLNIKVKDSLSMIYYIFIDREAGEIMRLVASVCLQLCPRSPVKKCQRVFISRSIQNGRAFKMVFVSTGCATAVDHAFNNG